jgi:hypothetical protein
MLLTVFKLITFECVFLYCLYFLYKINDIIIKLIMKIKQIINFL